MSFIAGLGVSAALAEPVGSDRFKIASHGVAAPVARGPVFEAAPTPNLDLLPPHGPNESSGPRVGPGLGLSSRATYRGDGYTPGSSPQTTIAPRHMPFPGINVKVPLN